MSRLLSLLGYEVSVAEDGMQALTSYQSEPVDLVLLDLNMPVKDGWETRTEIRQHDPNAKVIAMTGSMSHKRESTLCLGAYDLLRKPIEANVLQSAIEETLAQPV